MYQTQLLYWGATGRIFVEKIFLLFLVALEAKNDVYVELMSAALMKLYYLNARCWQWTLTSSRREEAEHNMALEFIYWSEAALAAEWNTYIYAAQLYS